MNRLSRHVGLVGGLGVGAAVIYYKAIAAGCAERGTVPRMTIAHADTATALGHVEAGRIDELAEYLGGFAGELAARFSGSRLRRGPHRRDSRTGSAPRHLTQGGEQ